MPGEVLIGGLLASGGEVANLSDLASIQGYRVGRSISVPNLPADAVFNLSYKTISGNPGELSIANQTTSGFDIISSSTTDTSTVSWNWVSASLAGSGGIQIR